MDKSEGRVCFFLVAAQPLMVRMSGLDHVGIRASVTSPSRPDGKFIKSVDFC